MLDAIQSQLHWLAKDLSALAESQGMYLHDVRDFIRDLCDEIRASEHPSMEFHRRCLEMGPSGDLVMAVHALDLCEGFVRFEPSSQATIVEQLCVATRLHERFKMGCEQAPALKEVWQELLSQSKSKHAARAAKAKHAADPKQVDKEFVHQCWQEWAREPARYESKAAFARDMLDKCEHIKSQKKIEDWCREWQRS